MCANKTTIVQDSLSRNDHKLVAEYIERTAGIQLPESKVSLIEGRLRKRQRKTGYPSLHQYINVVLNSNQDKQERLHLLDAITTNKTDFYREPDHFQTLRHHVLNTLAPLHLQGWKKPLRIWSAGCSSGEEPYTLAIELMELSRELPGLQFSIYATDISNSCLVTARNATYEHDRIDPVPMAMRKRYFLRSKDQTKNLVCMGPELRNKVNFGTFNLLTDEYKFQPRFDIIFCRNVMIYFNDKDRSQIIDRFSHSLTQGGLLFIGHSETIADRSKSFKQLVPTVYQKNEI
ncbi:CheR family methyltransferase [Colwellia sp. C1TZA3]|uniref:CheR family methyltransferase n=1 Tax=Colwellia sp. C1TZA3 TaxID=2508879 RepID=UPI0011B9FA7E|nr:protein-glutamate O-methyltransferase CheR [Colwellia sp. C1TZA3]TWX72765.1 protein-glutamate O-methyltransferase CheR [Colwellia sp. C1TZA3]